MPRAQSHENWLTIAKALISQVFLQVTGSVRKTGRQEVSVRSFSSSSKTVLLLIVALACRGASAAEKMDGFEGWNLEPGVGQAHLVMVARVASISRLTVVEGAKTDVALREYRFQPVQLLKGIFQRAELSMTASDLGCSEDGASLAPPLKEGEFRLLILAQQPGMRSFGGVQSFGCVSAAGPGVSTFDERVPLLTGPDDPLVAAVETLIKVADSRSRRERATLLIDRLADTDGIAAVPLLTSLQSRADWAATDGLGYAPVRPVDANSPNPSVLASLARNPSLAVRGAAVKVLRDMLATRIKPDDPRQLEDVAAALRTILNSDEANAPLRLVALEALGHLLALTDDIDWACEMLIDQLTAAPTYSEQAAAATALAQIKRPEAAAAVLDVLAALPLDETPERESVYVRAAVRSDAAAAERVLLTRLTRSMNARQSLQAEVTSLGRMRSKESLPLLLAAADQVNLPKNDRHYLAWALGRLGGEEAISVLTVWLRRDEFQVKAVALSALETIDSPIAAREVRPLLKSEAYLPYKLRIARLLARHDLADGYAMATEHLADVEHTPAAAMVLAALNDPRASKDLSEIIASQPDRRWHAAALAGLAAIGDPAAQKQLLDILADDRHPLAVGAAEAAGLADDPQLLRPLAKLMQSRNKQIAMASLMALRRFLTGVHSSPGGLSDVDLYDVNLDSHANDRGSLPPAVELPEDIQSDLAEAAAALVADAYVEPDVRRQALAVARLLGGERYETLLFDLADQAELEGSPLLALVQAERRRLHALGKEP